MALMMRDGETVLFIGDSITDCGRRADHPPLGCGFVKLFSDMALAREPEKRLNIINRGIGGDCIIAGMDCVKDSGLANRWDRDAIQHRPDWLCLMIGVNDAFSVFKPEVPSEPPEMYEAELDKLLTQLREELPACRILLMESFLMVGDRSLNPSQRNVVKLLPEYLAALKRLSEKHHTMFLETYKMIDNIVYRRGANALGPEMVHPDATGHMALTLAVYDAFSDA